MSRRLPAAVLRPAVPAVLGALLAGCPPAVRPPPAVPVPPPEEVLAPAMRTAPGRTATPLLRYRHPGATNVWIAGTWTQWRERRPMRPVAPGLWELDLRGLRAAAGPHEFKFLPDGAWEPGTNRRLTLDGRGWLVRAPAHALAARLEAADCVVAVLRRDPPPGAAVRARLEPGPAVASAVARPGSPRRGELGFGVAGGLVVFLFDPAVYRVAVAPTTVVAVAGSFNGWNASGGAEGEWRLADEDGDGVWERAAPLAGLAPSPGDPLDFRFVLDGARWLDPPAGAPNRAPDGHGNVNLRVTRELSAAPHVEVRTESPVPLSRPTALVVEGLAGGPARVAVAPGAVLDTLASARPLGVELDRAAGRTAYRLFAPRASAADLLLYDRPEAVETRDGRAVTNAPVAVVPMARAADGVWEAAREGLDVGRHYAFRVDGPAGAGEGFDAGAPVGDPYALAAAHAHGLPLVIDPAATNAWFPGGPPDGFRAPAATDLVIYEAHVRDLTSDPSSGVAPALRGTYPGLTASAGTGAALDHLAALGVNAIQFLPVAEFGNGTNDHGWGYNTVYFFAPEASYGTDPLRGSAYHEFKQLVRELHRRGFAVILDVVYNHVGEPNLFHRIDRPYYFRLDPDLGYRNASGCGNEFRSEAPMARRLIVDNVRYWMREHGVDGFRFDLAELIDLETLMAVRDAARELNPNVILISEPWSLRGDHKRALRGTGWAAWNNEFRDPAKHFALGRGDRDRLVKAVAGSVATWTAEPRQSVNYLESHDDSALADELSGRPDRDGRVPTEEAAARNRLAATLLFTSLGIPMIGEGQEFLRSKGGRHNTFAGGDAVNALRWADRQQPLAAEALAYYAGLIRLRRSPAGASLRLGDAPPPGYVEWILPPGETALGYAINGRRERPGAAFVVLANAGDAPFAFDVNWPPGAWRQVGDGRRIRPEGLDPDRGSAAPQRDRDGGGSPGRDRAPTGTEGGRPDGTGLPPPPFGLRRASPPPPFGLRRASPPSPFGPRWASPRVAEQGGRVVVPPRSAWVFMAD